MQSTRNNLKLQSCGPADDRRPRQPRNKFRPNDLRSPGKYPGLFAAEFSGFQLTGAALPDNSNTP
jgi:hypothetical protein